MRRLTVPFSVVLLLATAAGRTEALELTGTWSGTTSCTSLFQGSKLKFGDAPTLQVTQDESGRALGVRVDFGGGHVEHYVGRIHPDAKKPAEKGEIALVACGTDDVPGDGAAFDELGRFSASTKAGKTKATLKGVSFFSDPGTATPEAGTCRWKLTRTDLVDASIPTSCPVP